jgi:SWIM zinc finger
MATIKDSAPAYPSARELRGLQLYREHAEEICFEDSVWLVPSKSDGTSVYEVVISCRGESCECADHERRGIACKHIVAATIARAKTACCVGCGQRFPHRELVEVQEDHQSLTWFSGDRLCRRGCARAHGIL